MDKFFERLVEDLETYADHAKRKIIEVEDAELLLRRYVFCVSCCMTERTSLCQWRGSGLGRLREGGLC